MAIVPNIKIFLMPAVCSILAKFTFSKQIKSDHLEKNPPHLDGKPVTKIRSCGICSGSATAITYCNTYSKP